MQKQDEELTLLEDQLKAVIGRKKCCVDENKNSEKRYKPGFIEDINGYIQVYTNGVSRSNGLAGKSKYLY